LATDGHGPGDFLSSVAEARIAVVFSQVDERHIEVGAALGAGR
jgi:hypothetical protein